MSNVHDSNSLGGVVRLFPLPKVVLLPHAVLPLHIFEPRYRQMTEDALALGDKLITMVQLCDQGAAKGLGDPPIERVGCLGRIVQHQRLPDGRFNLLLLGFKRVRIVREVASDKLYRLAETKSLEEVSDGEPYERAKSELLDRFRRLAAQRPNWDQEFLRALKSDLSLSALTDLIAQAMELPTVTKQLLLEEQNPNQRARILLKILSKIDAEEWVQKSAARSFPPPFSVN